MIINPSVNSCSNEDKKNSKNIYVHKINSLKKLSKETLSKDDIEDSSNLQKQQMTKIIKNFKKSNSEIDKNTLKLQKNRQSAKKARLRKKIYIKLLEQQIQSFKKLKMEGDKLNSELESFLIEKDCTKKNLQLGQLISHDINVDKFLSGSDLEEITKAENLKFEEKLTERDEVIQELYHLQTRSLVKKLKNQKNIQIFKPILKRQVREDMENFQNLIKRISHNYEIVKNSFKKIHELTQKSKKISRISRIKTLQNQQLGKYYNDFIKVQDFMEKLDLNRQCDYNQQKNMVNQNYLQTNLVSKILNDFNLCSTQKLLIRSQKFLEHTLFESQS